MTCNQGFSQKSEELCLSNKANPYVGKLIDIMLDIDNGISILSKNFKDYGAASPYFINGDELLDVLESNDDEEARYAA